MEENITELEEQMTDPEVYQDHEKSLRLTSEMKELKLEEEKLMEEWAELLEAEEANL